MTSKKYQIDEKASSAYIMNLYQSKPEGANDVRFYMNVAYQMATTLVHKAANEGLEDSAYSVALISCINAGQTLSVQMTLNREVDKRKEIDSLVESLEREFYKLYSQGSVDDSRKAKNLANCMKLLRLISKNFAQFDMYIDRQASAEI